MNSDRARRRACAVALVVILALALWVRWVRAPFGLPYLHHWDEPQIASTALQMMKSGDFNPHYFHYGSLPIYVHLGVDVAHFFTLMRQDPIPFGLELAELNHDRVRLDDLQTRYDTGFHWEVSHPSFYLWNRRATAIFGALTVLLTFLLGRRLLGRHLLETSAALIAAAVLATQSFHVEHSAYVTTDVPMTFFAMASIYLAVRFAEDGRVGRLVGSLALGGLAVATKYSAALVLAAPIAALLAVCLATRKTGEASALETGAWHLFWLVPVVPVAAFFLAMPYALLDLPAFLAGAG